MQILSRSILALGLAWTPVAIADAATPADDEITEDRLPAFVEPVRAARLEGDLLHLEGVSEPQAWLDAALPGAAGARLPQAVVTGVDRTGALVQAVMILTEPVVDGDAVRFRIGWRQGAGLDDLRDVTLLIDARPT